MWDSDPQTSLTHDSVQNSQNFRGTFLLSICSQFCSMKNKVMVWIGSVLAGFYIQTRKPAGANHIHIKTLEYC